MTYYVTNGVMVLCMLGAIVALGRGYKKNLNYSWTWCLYIAAILIALLRRKYAATAFCDVLIITVALIGVLTISLKVEQFGTGIKFLYAMGLISAAAVFVQYILGDFYNNIYWRLFTQSWAEYVEHYYDKGYYTGLHAVPGQAAGAILFALGILVCYCLLKLYSKNKVKMRYYLIAALPLLAILLTGKKGVLIAGVASFLLLTIFLMAQRKQMFRLLLLFALIVAGYNVFRWYVLAHPDISFLYRFYQFFEAMETGNETVLTTGRNVLYEYAIELWQQHKLLGIGWRVFRDYTTSVYGYATKHDVNLDYLQMICECGIIGFTLMMTPILITLYRTINLARRTLKLNLSFDSKLSIMVACFIQFFTLIYAFFEIPFYDRTFFIVYAFSCIIVNSAYQEARMSITHSRRRVRIRTKPLPAGRRVA